MKLLVIGIGDCGCRLASEFAHLDRTARAKRHVSIISRTYALNNDKACLEALPRASHDTFQSILIRGLMTGDGKSTESGANFMRQESDRVLSAMRLGGFFEADAFMLVAGAGGAVGSGGAPVLSQILKERYVDKPVYALIILPFDYELDHPQRVHNTAVCLKAVDKTTDAIILVDGGGFGAGQHVTTVEQMATVNREIAFTFYDLLCAGEMTGAKNVGTNVLDAGDIKQCLAGWSAIGVGRAELSESLLPWKKSQDFKEKGSVTLKVVEAMNQALLHLSVDCKLENAGRSLYLLSVPARHANMEMVKVLGDRLRELAPNAEMREGSFYGSDGYTQVTVLVSELIYLERIRQFYERAARLVSAGAPPPTTGQPK
jgi:cell division GTPase FtsZ